MAENDQKNDPPFSARFWQLEMPRARVLDRTIRTIEASKISSIVHSCDFGVVIFSSGEILKTVSFPRRVSLRESKIIDLLQRDHYVGRKKFKSRSYEEKYFLRNRIINWN